MTIACVLAPAAPVLSAPASAEVEAGAATCAAIEGLIDAFKRERDAIYRRAGSAGLSGWDNAALDGLEAHLGAWIADLVVGKHTRARLGGRDLREIALVAQLSDRGDDEAGARGAVARTRMLVALAARPGAQP